MNVHLNKETLLGRTAKVVALPDGGRGEAEPSFSADLHIGTALRETFRSFARALAANEATLGLSIGMWFALRALWEEDGVTQAALSKRIDMLPAAVVSVVNSLEKAGLVERRKSMSDRRVHFLHLTPAGRRLRKRATAKAFEVDARALANVDPRDLERVLRVLAQLRRNLS